MAFNNIGKLFVLFLFVGFLLGLGFAGDQFPRCKEFDVALYTGGTSNEPPLPINGCEFIIETGGFNKIENKDVSVYSDNPANFAFVLKPNYKVAVNFYPWTWGWDDDFTIEVLIKKPDYSSFISLDKKRIDIDGEGPTKISFIDNSIEILSFDLIQPMNGVGVAKLMMKSSSTGIAANDPSTNIPFCGVNFNFKTSGDSCIISSLTKTNLKVPNITYDDTPYTATFEYDYPQKKINSQISSIKTYQKGQKQIVCALEKDILEIETTLKDSIKVTYSLNDNPDCGIKPTEKEDLKKVKSNTCVLTTETVEKCIIIDQELVTITTDKKLSVNGIDEKYPILEGQTYYCNYDLGKMYYKLDKGKIKQCKPKSDSATTPAKKTGIKTKKANATEKYLKTVDDYCEKNDCD